MTADPSSDGYSNIRYEVEDGRARITLAIPQTHNAITERMLAELEDAAWRADDDTSVHCLILRGEGPSLIEAMVAGKLNCTVECNPLLGPCIFDAIEAHRRGEALPKKISLKERLFEQHEAKDLIADRKY